MESHGCKQHFFLSYRQGGYQSVSVRDVSQTLRRPLKDGAETARPCLSGLRHDRNLSSRFLPIVVKKCILKASGKTNSRARAR